MAHLWEPLRVMPKPLIVPLASEAAGLLTRSLLHRQVGQLLITTSAETCNGAVSDFPHGSAACRAAGIGGDRSAHALHAAPPGGTGFRFCLLGEAGGGSGKHTTLLPT